MASQQPAAGAPLLGGSAMVVAGGGGGGPSCLTGRGGPQPTGPSPPPSSSYHHHHHHHQPQPPLLVQPPLQLVQKSLELTDALKQQLVQLNHLHHDLSSAPGNYASELAAMQHTLTTLKSAHTTKIKAEYEAEIRRLLTELERATGKRGHSALLSTPAPQSEGTAVKTPGSAGGSGPPAPDLSLLRSASLSEFSEGLSASSYQFTLPPPPASATPTVTTPMTLPPSAYSYPLMNGQPYPFQPFPPIPYPGGPPNAPPPPYGLGNGGPHYHHPQYGHVPPSPHGLPPSYDSRYNPRSANPYRPSSMNTPGPGSGGAGLGSATSNGGGPSALTYMGKPPNMGRPHPSRPPPLSGMSRSYSGHQHYPNNGPQSTAASQSGTNPPTSPNPVPQPLVRKPEATVFFDILPDNFPDTHKIENTVKDFTWIVNPSYFDNSDASSPLSLTLVHTAIHSAVVCVAVFSPDVRFFATGSSRKTTVFSVNTGAKYCEFISTTNEGGDCYIRALSFDPYGNDFIASGGENGVVSVWRLASGVKEPGSAAPTMTCFGHQADIYCIRWIPGKIISGSGDGTIMVFSDRDAKILHTFRIGFHAKESGVTSLDISSDFKSVVAGSLDDLIRVWSLETGTLLHTLSGHEKPVYSVSFSSVEGQVLSGSLDGMLRVWNLNTPTPTQTDICQGHRDFVLAVESPGKEWLPSCSDSWVASGSKDRHVIIWDIKRKTFVFCLKAHKNSIISVSTAKGGYLLTGSGDGTARLWKVTEKT